MKVLVTGGAGFIGSHVVDTLRAMGARVVCVDSLDRGVHHGPPVYLRAATGMGAAAALAKPFSADALLSAVENLLAKSEAG